MGGRWRWEGGDAVWMDGGEVEGRGGRGTGREIAQKRSSEVIHNFTHQHSSNVVFNCKQMPPTSVFHHLYERIYQTEQV